MMNVTGAKVASDEVQGSAFSKTAVTRARFPRRPPPGALLLWFLVLENSFGLICLALPISAQAEQRGFETFAPRATQAVVSADLMAGRHFQLAPYVRTFGFLNDYVISSDFGAFEANSDAMLRRTVREIGAIATLHDITVTDAYAKALKQAALAPVRGVGALVTEPVTTVKAVPTAVFDVFARLGQGIETYMKGQKTRYEDSATAQALQMSSYKREYAQDLGVDPYSSNPVLQEQLNSVAWAAAVGGLSVSAATMASSSTVVAAISAARSIDQALEIVASEPPAELTIRNRATLRNMGIDPRLAERFIAQKQYSPRAKTVLITSLAGLGDTVGKESVLQVALGAPDEVTAIFYQQVAELLNDYHTMIGRITRLERFNRLVLAHDAGGKAILLAPIDYLIWNEEAAAAVTEMASTLHLSRGGDHFELWITGTASPRFVTEANEAGIEVRVGVGKQLPLVD